MDVAETCESLNAVRRSTSYVCSHIKIVPMSTQDNVSDKQKLEPIAAKGVLCCVASEGVDKCLNIVYLL